MFSYIIDSERKVFTSQKNGRSLKLGFLEFLDYLRLVTVVCQIINEHKHRDFNKIIGPVMSLNNYLLKNNDTSSVFKKNYLQSNKTTMLGETNGRMN